MLRFDDPLPRAPQRVLIAGVTGVGKSTLGQRLGLLWGLPYTNLDALHWGPAWTPRPEFQAETQALASSQQWVTEWQYWGKGLKHVFGDRADAVIWMNFPRPLALQRLLRRTVKRSITREPLFDGCVEPPLWAVFTDENHILRWERKTHSKWRERMPALVTELPETTFVELRSPRQVRRWLAGPAAAWEAFSNSDGQPEV